MSESDRWLRRRWKAPILVVATFLIGCAESHSPELGPDAGTDEDATVAHDAGPSLTCDEAQEAFADAVAAFDDPNECDTVDDCIVASAERACFDFTGVFTSCRPLHQDSLAEFQEAIPDPCDQAALPCPTATDECGVGGLICWEGRCTSAWILCNGQEFCGATGECDSAAYCLNGCCIHL